MAYVVFTFLASLPRVFFFSIRRLFFYERNKRNKREEEENLQEYVVAREAEEQV